MRTTATAATLAFLLVPALVHGQEPVQSFDQLNTRLKVGDNILVTDTEGREHRGKILDLSPAALTLDIDRGKKLAAADVRLVEDRERDSLKNGALIGLASGVALSVFAAAHCTEGCDVSQGEFFLIAAGIYGGIGAAIGTGIDALIPGKRRVVYTAPNSKPATRVMLGPVITPRSAGVAVSFGF